jgi:hypothetical protein
MTMMHPIVRKNPEWLTELRQLRTILEQPSVSGSMIDATTNHSVPKSTLYKRDMTRMFEMSSPRAALEAPADLNLSRNIDLVMPSNKAVVKTLPECDNTKV